MERERGLSAPFTTFAFPLAAKPEVTNALYVADINRAAIPDAFHENGPAIQRVGAVCGTQAMGSETWIPNPYFDDRRANTHAHRDTRVGVACARYQRER